VSVVKIVAQVKLLPEADQTAALRSTLRAVNNAAGWVSQIASSAAFRVSTSCASTPMPN
jgi:hypothetical protein